MESLLDRPTVIMGDFNWNVIWDANPDYPLYGTLTEVIKILDNKKIRSAYHEFYKEDFGKETKPTLFMFHRQRGLTMLIIVLHPQILKSPM